MKAAMTVIVSTLALSDIAQAGCTLYQHRDYGGSSYYLDDNTTVTMVAEARCEKNTHSGAVSCDEAAPSWNDQVSSFKVERGCKLTMWQHIDGGGARFVRSNNVKYVGSAWNDQASEARCSCN